jgi:hypothetical protein
MEKSEDDCSNFTQQTGGNIVGWSRQLTLQKPYKNPWRRQTQGQGTGRAPKQVSTVQAPLKSLRDFRMRNEYMENATRSVVSIHTIHKIYSNQGHFLHTQHHEHKSMRYCFDIHIHFVVPHSKCKASKHRCSRNNFGRIKNITKLISTLKIIIELQNA